MLDGNRYFGPISQAVDLILQDVDRKRQTMELKQQRQEQLAQQKQQDQTNKRFSLLGNMFGNKDLTPEFRQEVGKTLLGTVGMNDAPVPEFKDNADGLHALPDDPNDDLYRVFPALKNYAGKAMWKASEMQQIANNYASRYEQQRHNKASESRLAKGLATKQKNSKVYQKKNDERKAIRNFQLREMERMEQQFADNPDVLNEIRRNKARLGQEPSNAFSPEEFQKFIEAPQAYVEQAKGDFYRANTRITPDKVRQIMGSNPAQAAPEAAAQPAAPTLAPIDSFRQGSAAQSPAAQQVAAPADSATQRAMREEFLRSMKQFQKAMKE